MPATALVQDHPRDSESRSAFSQRSIAALTSLAARRADRASPRAAPARSRRAAATSAQDGRRRRPASADRARRRRTAACRAAASAPSAPARPSTRPMPVSVMPFAAPCRSSAARGRAERGADADLVRALRHRVRDHAVDADRGEQQRQRGEDRRAASSAARVRCRRTRVLICSSVRMSVTAWFLIDLVHGLRHRASQATSGSIAPTHDEADERRRALFHAARTRRLASCPRARSCARRR